MCDKNRPIGIFDSGVGGLSVLKQAIKILPNEDFIYFGDSANAPYGTKNVDEVKKLTYNAIDFFINKECKAVVIACNTATSVAIDDIRKKYFNIPIVGIEPALKPAVEFHKTGSIIIMATPITLAERKFNNLMHKYEKESKIIPLPCAGLVELIECGIIEGEKVNEYLRNKLDNLLDTNISAIVLGCTHYPFIKKELSKIVGEDVCIIDGSEGTAKQLKRKLLLSNIANEQNKDGNIKIYNSKQDSNLIDLSYKLLKIDI